MAFHIKSVVGELKNTRISGKIRVFLMKRNILRVIQSRDKDRADCFKDSLFYIQKWKRLCINNCFLLQ